MSIQSHLNISVCKSAEEAIQRGFFYKKPVYSPISITQVVVVEEGTVNGKSTVDLILQDEQGNKFVVMLTGALIKSIPC